MAVWISLLVFRYPEIVTKMTPKIVVHAVGMQKKIRKFHF